MYYLRTKAAAQAIQFTVDKTKLKSSSKTTSEKGQGDGKKDEKDLADAEANMAAMVCSIENKEACMMCSG